eukprot:COSAG02_NODE_64461_length_260_cov_0.956522_1_plen_54_part_10
MERQYLCVAQPAPNHHLAVDTSSRGRLQSLRCSVGRLPLPLAPEVIYLASVADL